MAKTIFVTRNLPKKAVEMLNATNHRIIHRKEDSPISREDLLRGISDADALFCLLTDKIDEKLLENAPLLKVIGTMSVGFDHIDLKACKARGIKVGYTPDVLSEATAELTIGLLLMTSRRMLEANRAVYNGDWGTWHPLWMCGKGIQNSTVGIVGLGRIGQSVASKLVPFKPGKVLYAGRSKKDYAGSLNAEFCQLDDLLALSDFVVVCCALDESTKNMFDAAAFSKMKTGATFINTSRGGLVDADALYEALKSGKLFAAGLDVSNPEPMRPDHKLLKLSNFVMLPHIGSATVETRERMATLTVENITAGLAGLPMPAQLI